jgi:acyl-CoA thioesterase-1
MPYRANPLRTLLIASAAVVLACASLTACGWSREVPTGVVPVHVALGASDAVGVGAARPAQDGWVPLVTAGLPEGTQLVNLGVSGATLSDVIAGQLPIAIDADPRWVTLWPGPNDLRNGVALETFSGQLEQILAALQPATGERRTVAVLNLPDLRVLPAFARTDRATLDAQVRTWNAAIAATVSRHAQYAVLVDLHANWAELAAHPDYISADGFHPSSAGYRRIADLTLETLRRDDPTLTR